ncbi:MAG: hypothetical protein JSS81_03000 [Acidobacteria bacterium]|nr:hypothetical protein [Acidobacteriota bacterium]
MKIFRPFSPFLLVLFCSVLFFNVRAEPFRCSSGDLDNLKPTIVPTPTNGGIREEIADKYLEKYNRWKEELLSTEYGRQQWELYAGNKNFILTITMSDKRGHGAGTDKYLWDEEGRFVGATITLGTKIEKGFPDPIYYPVMNSLSIGMDKYPIGGELLAATKMAHEFGHVNQTAKANRELLQTQSKLVPEYVAIFLKNGRNTQDKELLKLAEKMGGTPVEIWENREYWSEVSAMAYLKEKIGKENYYCTVFSKIQYNIESYAKPYEGRFESIGEFPDAACRK